MRLLSLLTLILLSHTLAAAPVAIQGHYTPLPPVIDGRLDEAAWAAAPAVDTFTVMQTSRPASRRTELRILYTDLAIVFGFRAEVPADKLASVEEARQAKVFATDCVELMLDPTGGSDSYFHFIVNSVNTRFQRSCEQGGYVGNTEWQTEWNSAAHRGDGFWSAEIELPYRSLELNRADAAAWSFNAARESYNLEGGHPEVSTLAENGVTHSAGAFRRLLPPPTDLSPYLWHVGVPELRQKIVGGKLEVVAQSGITHYSQTPRRIKAEAALFAADGRRAATTVTLDAPAAAELKVAWPPLLLPEPGTYSGALTLRDAASNRILQRRLLTAELSYIPVSIRLLDPHYRQAIFATQKLEHVDYQVDIHLEPEKIAGLRLHSGIRRPGQAPAQEKHGLAAAENHFRFPVAALADGEWEVFARLLDGAGQLVAESATALRKLPYKKNEVWRGKDGHWYVDGKKIFLLSSWGTGEVSRLPQFNVIFKHPDDPEHPAMFFNQRTGFGFGKAFREKLKREGATPEILDIYRERTRAAMDDPGLFAHYLIDEPDCAGYSRELFATIAQAIAAEDPYHPIVISTGSAGIINYPDCGEINGFHCYPNPIPGQPMSNFKKIVVLMDKGREFFATSPIQQSIAYLHQGFNYGDCGSRNSRIPSYEEYRNQNILAFILGAIGLLHYNRTEEQYPELYLGFPHLVAEQKIIGEEAVIHPDAPVAPQAQRPELRLLGKANPDGSFWLLAGNASDETLTSPITWPAWADGEIQVLSEGRTVTLRNGSFSDHFTPYQTRVYTNSGKTFNLATVATVNAAIEAEYARLAKPGNLAWQRFEYDTVTVRASSNASGNQRPDTALWHLADGFCAGRVAKSAHSGGIITYSDSTPNEAPDWVEFEFKQPVSIGRVVLYPVDNALLAYQIQVRRGDDYVTVASADAADGEILTHAFAPVEAQTLRLLVTATRGPHARLYEIEVYEK